MIYKGLKNKFIIIILFIRVYKSFIKLKYKLYIKQEVTK